MVALHKQGFDQVIAQRDREGDKKVKTLVSRAYYKLINKLVELGKPFQFMEYPNRTHGITEGRGTQLHVYTLIARYLEEHLPAGGR